MEPVSFQIPMRRTRQILLWNILLLFMLALSAGLLYYFGGKSLYRAVEIVAGVGVALFLLVLAFLLISYLRKPEVREKNKYQRQLKKMHRKVQSVQSNLAQALQTGDAIRKRSQELHTNERQKWEERNKELDTKINQLFSAKDQQLAVELVQLQNDYLERGLKANQLDPVDIPGVGAVLIEKLNAAGIRTAYDVTSATVQAIPGFGESKALSLVRWRESVERALRENQPQALPDARQLAIETQYAAQIEKLHQEQAESKTAYENALQKLQEQEAQELASVVSQEITARHQLNELEAGKQALQEQLNRYSRITFRRMLTAALTNEQANLLKQGLAFLALVAFIVCGLFNVALFIYIIAFTKP